MSEVHASTVLGTVNGSPVKWTTFLSALKCEGAWSASVAALLRYVFIAELASRHQIAIADSELQAAADQFRARRGLHKASDTYQWIAQELIEEDEFARLVEHELIVDKLKRVFSDEAVQNKFTAERNRFDRARLAQIVVDSKGLADELLTRLVEDGDDFSTLARQHSLDQDSKDNGGFLGILNRTDMSSEVADTVFASQPGNTLGPFRIAGAYHLVKTLELLPASLDEATSELLRNEMLDEAITLAIAAADIELRFDIED
ncbi:MAG: peptidylprolyl isomerase [Planctomycetales bacterium]|nr:peptidylprolyl isomerase [Planctomycetales bacterium]